MKNINSLRGLKSAMYTGNYHRRTAVVFRAHSVSGIFSFITFFFSDGMFSINAPASCSYPAAHLIIMIENDRCIPYRFMPNGARYRCYLCVYAL